MGLVILLIGICLVVPLASVLKGNDRLISWLWFGIGFVLFFYPTVPQFGIMLSGMNMWPGHTKGFEVTIVDLPVVAYLMATRGQSSKLKLPFKSGMIFYFSVVVATVIISRINVIGFYYVFQLLRVFMIFYAVARMAQNRDHLDKLLDGLSVGLVMELGFVIVQKFVFHVAQPTGTFYHQNVLGVTNNLLLVVLATPLLARKDKPLRFAAAGCALLIPALIASRGTAFLAAGGLGATFLYSIIRSPSGRKAGFGMVGVCLSLVLVPLALSSFGQRYKGSDWAAFEDEGYDERAAYKAAAWEMLADHPLGVGPNNFVVAANSFGYYQRNGVDLNFSSLSGSVHNIYLLTACENGWIGLAALLVMLLTPVVKGLKAVRTLPAGNDREFIAGITVALTFCYIHSFYEWMLVLADPQYTLAIIFGMLAALLMKNENALGGVRARREPGYKSSSVDRKQPVPTRKISF